MKTAIVVAALVLATFPALASDTDRPRHFETENDCVSEVLTGVRRLKVGMTFEETMRSFRGAASWIRLQSTRNHDWWSGSFTLDRKHFLFLSFDDHGLSTARFERDGKVVVQIGQ